MHKNLLLIPMRTCAYMCIAGYLLSGSSKQKPVVILGTHQQNGGGGDYTVHRNLLIHKNKFCKFTDYLLCLAFISKFN